MRTTFRTLVICAAVLLASLVAVTEAADALTIQATFDSSIVNAPNAADIENTINFATNEISSLFSNPGTVTILFKYRSGNFLGESNSSFYFDTYSTVTSELQANLSANPQNAVLATALSNLSSGNDANGVRDIEATSAEFRLALGDNTATPCFDAGGNFVNGCNAVFDGVITLSSTQPIDFTRPVPAYDGTNLEYDGVRVAEHEIDEVLGGGGSGSMLGSPDQATKYGILDLYRYSAPGTPSYTGSGAATSYFSIDGGNTNIVGFNQNHNGDYADWGPSATPCAGGGSGGPGFVQDAFSCNNVQADVTTSSPEYTMLQAIGYDPAAPPGFIWDCSTNPDSVAHTGATSATKINACAQVVLGNNTYTGGTTISAGTLQIGNGGTAGAIAGNVTDNGVLAFDTVNQVPFAGVISGSGSLLKEADGAIYLTGANTYTGGTTIAGGSLVLGNNGTTGSITGNVVDNGYLYVYRTNAYTFAGNISGTGVFVQAGSGTTILTGTNTYSGGTIVNAGILQIGDGSTAGSIVGNVTDNSALLFNSAAEFTIDGVVSGPGSVAKAGNGAIFLTNANTYSGGTSILGGSLVLGNNGTTGSIQGDVVDNGYFYVYRTNPYSFSGNISGTGVFEQAGSGTTILTGSTTYTGGTIIRAGTLQFGNGGTVSIPGNVADFGVLAINNSNEFVYGGVISGSGPVVKSGNGAVFLTNANTYSGGTTINGGSLVIGDNGTSGSIAGNVVNNGYLYVYRTDTYVLSGSIAGSGVFVQAGSGTTVLTAANGYTGGTLIKAGTLQLGTGAGGSDGSLVGNVTDNGALVFVDNNKVVIDGVISGMGTLATQGPANGPVFLTGANTYTGGTVISAGSLVLGENGASGSIAGNVVDNTNFYIYRSDHYTFAGGISGAGVFQQAGSGATTLTGANTYSGGTIVSGGSLEATSSSSFGSGKVSLNATSATLLLDNGVNLANEIDINQSSFIDVNGSDTATISGALVGSAPFEKDGTGTLVLNHDNRATYSGNISYHGTLIAGTTGAFGTGTVTVLGSTLLLADGVVDDTATVLADNLTVTQNGASAEISGDISQLGGPWGLSKEGAGTLVLTGTDTYSGATQVDEGILSVNGSIASSVVTLGAGTTLKGTGTVGGIIAGGRATVAPGNSIGTLHVAGNVSFGPGSTYQVEVNQVGQSDEIVATGTGTLTGGIVQVTAAPGPYPPLTTYTILTAPGGVTGKFDGVISNLTIFVPSLVYKADEVDLTLQFESLPSFARTTNQASVAAAIQGNFAGTLFNIVATRAPGDLDRAFDATSGEIHASLLSAELEQEQSLRQAVLDRLRDATSGEVSAVWGRLFGSWGAIASDGNAAEMNTNFSGLTIGADTSLGDGFRVGLDGGYGQAQGFAGARGSSFVASGTHLGIYGGYGEGPLFLKAGAIGSWGNARTHRAVTFSGFSESETARQSTRTAQTFVEASYAVFSDDGLTLEPFVNGGWMRASAGSFAETGGIAALSGTHSDDDVPFSTVGVRWSAALTGPDGSEILPNATLGWMHGFHDLSAARTLTFEATGNSFTVLGVPLDRDEALVDVGVAFRPLANLALNLGYEGFLSQRVRDNALHANIAWNF